MSAAAAIAINSSAGRTQPDSDDDAASGAGTTGASIVAGAGDLFHFVTSYVAKRACFLGHDLLRARCIFNILR